MVDDVINTATESGGQTGRSMSVTATTWTVTQFSIDIFSYVIVLYENGHTHLL